MDINSKNMPQEPISRIMGYISRIYYGTLKKELIPLGIERGYYPLLLIDSGNGMLTQQNLADKLSIDKVQVVRLVDYLSDNGFIERVQNPKDRREYMLHLTAKGYQILPEVKKAEKKLYDTAFKGLSEEEINSMRDKLYFILKNIIGFRDNIKK
jgi:DNA-binding MarR family transcriptional regulator